MRARLVLALAIAVALHSSALANNNGCQDANGQYIHVATQACNRLCSSSSISTKRGQFAKCCLDNRAGEGFSAGAPVLPRDDGGGRGRDSGGEGNAGLDRRLSVTDEKVQRRNVISQRAPVPPQPNQLPNPHSPPTGQPLPHAAALFSGYAAAPSSGHTITSDDRPSTFDGNHDMPGGQETTYQSSLHNVLSPYSHTITSTFSLSIFDGHHLMSGGRETPHHPLTNTAPPSSGHTITSDGHPFTFDGYHVMPGGQETPYQPSLHNAPHSYGHTIPSDDYLPIFDSYPIMSGGQETTHHPLTDAVSPFSGHTITSDDHRSIFDGHHIMSGGQDTTYHPLTNAAPPSSGHTITSDGHPSTFDGYHVMLGGQETPYQPLLHDAPYSYGPSTTSTFDNYRIMSGGQETRHHPLTNAAPPSSGHTITSDGRPSTFNVYHVMPGGHEIPRHPLTPAGPPFSGHRIKSGGTSKPPPRGKIQLSSLNYVYLLKYYVIPGQYQQTGTVALTVAKKTYVINGRLVSPPRDGYRPREGVHQFITAGQNKFYFQGKLKVRFNSSQNKRPGPGLKIIRVEDRAFMLAGHLVPEPDKSSKTEDKSPSIIKSFTINGYPLFYKGRMEEVKFNRIEPT